MKWLRTHHGRYTLELEPGIYQIQERSRPPVFEVYRLDELIATCKELRYAKAIVEHQFRLRSKLGGKKSNFYVDKQVRTTDSDYFMCDDERCLVTVTLQKQRRKATPWRVSVWGPDDIGMDLEIATYDEAKTVFDSIQDRVTKWHLRCMKFRQA